MGKQPKTQESAERFSVSTEGMAQLHRDREPWYLVKELVANAWDEDADADVTVSMTDDGLSVSVEDNGGGFANVEDAYTLMRPTSKRSNALVRGRFNIGEKEIFSLARYGSIETVGFTVEFPEGGGRKVYENDRTTGTIVTAVVAEWDANDAANIIEMLERFRPPADSLYTVNGNVVARKDTHYSTNETLESVLQSGQSLRRTYRKADIQISAAPRRAEGGVDTDEAGWLYEMGIPVQPIDCPWDVNVEQKIPLSPNRDSAPERYLREIYSIVLNETHAVLREDEASRGWVMAATENKRADDKAVMKVFDTRFGEGAVIKSTWDMEANQRAIENNRTLIPRSALSVGERNRFKDAGALDAHGEYGREGQSTERKKQPILTDGMKQIQTYAEWLALTVLGHPIVVEFIRTEKKILAQYGGVMMEFNVRRLGPQWFDGPINQKHTDLILHELAHDTPLESEGGVAHHGDYVHMLSSIGAKAIHAALAMGPNAWGGDLPIDVPGS